MIGVLALTLPFPLICIIMVCLFEMKLPYFERHVAGCQCLECRIARAEK